MYKVARQRLIVAILIVMIRSNCFSQQYDSSVVELSSRDDFSDWRTDIRAWDFSSFLKPHKFGVLEFGVIVRNDDDVYLILSNMYGLADIRKLFVRIPIIRGGFDTVELGLVMDDVQQTIGQAVEGFQVVSLDDRRNANLFAAALDLQLVPAVECKKDMFVTIFWERGFTSPLGIEKDREIVDRLDSTIVSTDHVCRSHDRILKRDEVFCLMRTESIFSYVDLAVGQIVFANGDRKAPLGVFGRYVKINMSEPIKIKTSYHIWTFDRIKEFVSKM